MIRMFFNAPIESVEEFKICGLAALLSVRYGKGFDWRVKLSYTLLDDLTQFFKIIA